MSLNDFSLGQFFTALIFSFPFKLPEPIQRILRIGLHPYEIDTFLNWQKDRASLISQKPIKRHWREPSLHLWYKSRCRPGKQSQKPRVFRPRSYWYSPGSWLVHSIIRKLLPGTKSDRILFWRRFSIHCLFLSLSNDKRWWDPIG